MAEKRQTAVSLEDADYLGVDALRAVLGVSRSETIRQLVKAGMPILQAEQASRLARLKRLARQAGQTFDEYVTAYATRNASRTYGETLEELEECGAKTSA
jgi:hypothetical protein